MRVSAERLATSFRREVGMELAAGDAIVRHWRIEDAEGLARAADDRRIWLNLRDAFPHPYSVADARRFLAVALGLTPQTYFAIERAGVVAGGIGYTPRSDVERVGAEIGYWLGADHWGRGIATAAVVAVTRHAFDAHPELRRIYAVPFASNPASARVLEKAGYALEGTLRESVVKDGRVLDQWMYAALRSRHAVRDGGLA
jgi:ribosomal-protein-alanine N-acetyltransferase